ncbi:VPS9 domain-containing protein [[Candida] zeylanoides]
MTGSNFPAFSISKATPTTSTTNATTVSGSSVPATAASASHTEQPESATEFEGADLTPKFGPTNPVPISSVSPTLAVSDPEEPRASRPDLIGLFDKFDINKSETRLSESELETKDAESEAEEAHEKASSEIKTEKVESGEAVHELKWDAPHSSAPSSAAADAGPASPSTESGLDTVEMADSGVSDAEVERLVEANVSSSSDVDATVRSDDSGVGRRPPLSSRKLSSVDPGEQHQQSHKPFDFQNFLNQLKKKSSDPIVRYIRSFLVSFSRQAHTFSSSQKVKIIADFKIFIDEKFGLYEPFASMDDIDLENSREGLEKLIMNRLYDYCFPPAIARTQGSTEPQLDLDEDRLFSQQVDKFSWVNGIHLDIDLSTLMQGRSRGSKGAQFVEHAVSELNKINNYRAPRDKIICVLNSCKIIFGFLKLNRQETNADSFVPLLILVIIKAKPKNLVSNMHYIEHYRAPEWLSHGETSYYLSSLQGAIGFIRELGVKDLTITQEEYDAHMEAWEAQQRQNASQEVADVTEASAASSSPSTVPLQSPQPQHPGVGGDEQAQVRMSPSDVIITSAGMVGKSIANFLSPSPQPEPESIPNAVSASTEMSPSADSAAANKQAVDTLTSMFPNLDHSILKDLVYIKKGNLDECVDTCLELVADA